MNKMFVIVICNKIRLNSILFTDRFSWLTPEVLPQEVASSIIKAQRRNYENQSVPSYWLPVSKLGKYV